MGFEGFFYRLQQGIGSARCLMLKEGKEGRWISYLYKHITVGKDITIISFDYL